MDKQFAIAALLVASVAFFIKSEVVSDKLDDAKRQIEDAEIQLTELEEAKIRVEELENELYSMDEKVRDESNWSFGEGYDEGYLDGWNDGLDKGYENGYGHGYEQGELDAEYDFQLRMDGELDNRYEEAYGDCLDDVNTIGFNQAYKEYYGLYPAEYEVYYHSGLYGITMYETPQSSCFSRVGYGRGGETLYVIFRNSGVAYKYFGVDEDTYERLMNDDSLGSFFNKAIKPYYECEKIGAIKLPFSD